MKALYTLNSPPVVSFNIMVWGIGIVVLCPEHPQEACFSGYLRTTRPLLGNLINPKALNFKAFGPKDPTI